MKETSYINENSKVITLLKNIHRFSIFSDNDINALLKLSKIREYETGEVIIKEDTFDSWIYFLLSGSLDIIKNGKIITHMSRCGDVFGEMGVIDGSARSATIQAATKSLVLAMDGSIVDRQINDDQIGFCYIIYRMFAEVLAIRLRETTEEYTALKEEYAKLKDNREV